MALFAAALAVRHVIVHVYGTSDGASAAWAAAIGAVGGGAVGALATYFATRRQVAAAKTEGDAQRTHDREERDRDREAAQALAQLEHQHQEAKARDDRLFDSRRDAYLEVVRYLLWLGAYARWKRLSLTTPDTPDTPPKPPTGLDEEANVFAALFLTREAAERVQATNDGLRELRKAVDVLDITPHGPNRLTPFNMVVAAAEAIDPLVMGALDQMHRDLNGSQAQ